MSKKMSEEDQIKKITKQFDVAMAKYGYEINAILMFNPKTSAALTLLNGSSKRIGVLIDHVLTEHPPVMMGMIDHKLGHVLDEALTPMNRKEKAPRKAAKRSKKS